MSDNKTPPSIDKVFMIEEILPNATTAFEDEPTSIDKAIEEADVVLDTNVLLIPYGAGQSSLTQIIKVYKKIKDQNRLHIPAQVAREFVKNRPIKLAQLYQGISDKVSELSIIEKLSYPILESVNDFNQLNEVINQLVELKSKIKNSAKLVRQEIKDWGCNDPVSQAYRPVFTKEVVISPQAINKEILLTEMLRRYEHSIPPGYKDASKPDAGIGDYLIWKTILDIGKKNKKNLVFVSGDEKSDWFHGAEGNGFIPRFELQAEYRRISEGKDFFIIPLSQLLSLKNAEESTVIEVKSEEVRIRNANLVNVDCPECNSIGEYELSENIGTSALPSCKDCGKKFHLHRTKDGISTRPYKSNKSSNIQNSTEKDLEIVSCPSCNEIDIKELGIKVFSTAWCVCTECGKKYPIHRKADGTVHVNSNYTE